MTAEGDQRGEPNEQGRTQSPSETPANPEVSKMERFYEAWQYLESHPIFEVGKLESSNGTLVPTHRFDMSLKTEVVKVNPEIDDDPSKNTKVQVWLEAGPYEDLGITDGYDEPTGIKGFSHDVDLDSREDTFEDAIIELANRIRDKYDQPQQPQEESTSG